MVRNMWTISKYLFKIDVLPTFASPTSRTLNGPITTSPPDISLSNFTPDMSADDLYNDNRSPI